MSGDSELDDFKRAIDLRRYAASKGFEWDRRESWRGSAVMRRGAGKIVVKVNGNGHWVFFDVHDERNNGTIIDFVQHELRLSLGAVRKELRPWVGQASSPALPEFPALAPVPRDLRAVEAAYACMQVAERSAYLESRGIPAALLTSARFAGCVRIDGHGNVAFPHVDETGALCGFELKNDGWVGFASGGYKGVFLSNTAPTDRQLVIVEGAIDALSHALLFPAEDVRYASVGGQLGARQPAAIGAVLADLPGGSAVVLATDNDAPGEVLAGVLQGIFEGAGRPDLRCARQRPVEGFKDWNDILTLG